MGLWQAIENLFRGPAATAALEPMLAGQRYAAIADTSDEWNRAFNAGYAADLGQFGRDVAAAIEDSMEGVQRAVESLQNALAELEAKVTVES